MRPTKRERERERERKRKRKRKRKRERERWREVNIIPILASTSLQIIPLFALIVWYSARVNINTQLERSYISFKYALGIHTCT